MLEDLHAMRQRKKKSSSRKKKSIEPDPTSQYLLRPPNYVMHTLSSDPNAPFSTILGGGTTFHHMAHTQTTPSNAYIPSMMGNSPRGWQYPRSIPVPGSMARGSALQMRTLDSRTCHQLTRLTAGVCQTI